MKNIIEYKIIGIDYAKKIIEIHCNLHPDKLNKNPAYGKFFARHGIKAVWRRPFEGGCVYSLSFASLRRETELPQLFPIWNGKRVFLPGWSFLLFPLITKRKKFSLKIADELQQNIIGMTPEPVPFDAARDTCIICNYSSVELNIHNCRFKIFCGNKAHEFFLAGIVKKILYAHYSHFKKWLYPQYNFIFDQQNPVLAKQAGYSFFSENIGFSRLYVRHAVADNDEKLVDLMDLIEHELLHPYIEARTPSGSWLVEGLTTYLARKILYKGNVFNRFQWQYIVRKSFLDYLNNPLAEKVSIKDAEKKFFEKGYGNLIFNKGFFIAFLLDKRINLLDITTKLFPIRILKGKMITNKDFNSFISKEYISYMRHLMHQKNLTSEFLNIFEIC